MKKVIVVFAIAFNSISISANAQLTNNLFKKGDRVCFVGNSITHNGEFHHNILQYYVTRFPKQPMHFFNAGVKGDVTSGILKRMDNDILTHKPTHAVIMIGMNDVQRQLYTNRLIEKVDTLTMRKIALELYAKNLDSIVRIFLKKGIKVILQKPSPFDETSTIKVPNGLGINDALYKCSEIIQALANKYKLLTVDYWTILTNISNKIQQKNPATTLTVNDRVHPNSTGHLIMAYQFLQSTNAPSLVSKMVFDVKKINNHATNSNCTVKKVVYNNDVLSATVLENALPFPLVDKQQEAALLIPFVQDLNNQILQVHNLKKGKYKLLIDGNVIDNFSNEALQQGVNLSFYKQTPQYKQAILVHEKLSKLWELEATLRAIAFVEYMHLQDFVNKDDMVATKRYLDSLLAKRFNGQQYYYNSFEKYIIYKPLYSKLLQQSDSLLKIIYEQAQPIAHEFLLKPIEEPSVNALIEASQSAAMPLLFNVQPKLLIQEIDTFTSSKEFFERNGLPNFFNKIYKKNTALTIGFLGGSITKAEDQYRNQTLAFIQSLNNTARLKGINAGVSGTGTELGACRVGEQLLKYNPDLVFIEFAVNGGSNEAMEGIVRQIKKHNPQTDICFIYTIAGEQYKQYAKNELPSKITDFEKVADYYKIPSIHLGLYPSVLITQGKLTWKGEVEASNKKIFSKDGTHPNKAGGDVYTQAIVRAFNKFKNTDTIKHYEMPTPLYADNWEDGGMYSPLEVGSFSKGWENVQTSNYPNLKDFAPWFVNISKTSEPNASFVFKFKGTSFGFFDIGGPEVGQVLVEIDGNCTKPKRKAGNVSVKIPNETVYECIVNRFNTFCNNRYRGQFEMFEVSNAEHEVKLTLSSIKANKLAILEGQDLLDIQQNPDKYNEQIFFLGKILIKGTITKNK